MINKSIVNFKEVFSQKRIDAEYYKPEYLELDKELFKIGFYNLGDKEVSGFITDGDHGNPIYDENGEIYIKSKNLFGFNLDLEGIDRLYKDYSKKISKKCLIKEDDVLLTTVGTIGICYLAQLEDKNYILSRDIAKIETKEDKLIPEFLYLFLKTKIGKMQIERFSSGSLQGGLYLNAIKKIKVPKVSINEQNKFIPKVEEIFNDIKKSKSLYNKAKNLVEEKINIDKSKIRKKKTFSKPFSELIKNKRMDSEYYKLEYEDIIKLIQQKDYTNLKKEYIKNKNFIPESEKKYNYIELANINSSFGIIENFMNDFGSNLPTRARRKINEGEVIISSIEGSLNSSALINKENDNSICSTGFFVLKVDEYYFSEFLILLMKSKLIQSLLKRGCSGTILRAITKDELMKIPLPIIYKNQQKEIIDLLQEAHSYYYKARDKLMESTNEVERLIGI